MEPDRLKTARRRQMWLFAGLLLFGARIAWSFVEIQVLSHGRYVEAAQRQQKKRVEIPPDRGAIFDRSGVPLAVNREQYGVYLVPRHVQDPDRLVEGLVEILGVGEGEVRRGIARGGWYVRLVRGIDREAVRRLEAADLDGVGVETYQVRHYPNGSLAASVIGRVDVDNVGIEGIELQYDEALRGRPGYAVHQRDALGREYPNFTYPVEPSVDGRDVYLTIDLAMQEIVESALDSAMVRTRARAGSVVVVDPQTGEVVAMASRSVERPHANIAVVDQFEPGSTFKIVPLTGLYEERLAEPTDSLFCENGVWNLAGRTFRDVHPYGTLSVEEVIGESSNICSVKLTRTLGAKRLYEYARRFGYGLPSGIDFPGEPRGQLKRPDTWSALTEASVAMGYEVMVTSMQQAMAYGSIANGGELLRPFLVRKIVDPDGAVSYEGERQSVRRVMSPRTARLVTQALVRVVDGGTARSAQIELLPVAGKTGTARKVNENGRYVAGRYTSSFAGYFPAEGARYVVFVRIDEPVGAFYGGAVAAPVFREAMEGNLLTEGMDESPNLVERIRAPERVLWTVSDDFGGVPPPPPTDPSVPEPTAEVGSSAGPAEAAVGLAEDPDVAPPFDPRRQVKVPDFAGRSLREAVREAARLGLEITFEGTGPIAEQWPEPGEVVARGATVRVRSE